MFPTLTLGGQTVETTGLGVIVSIFVFVLFSYSFAKKAGLDAKQILYALPTLIIVTYFSGSYFGFFLRTGHLFPYSIIELGQIIIPPNYSFHAGGLSIGIIASLLIFLYQLPLKSGRKQRLDVLSLAFMLGIVILGAFLIFGDHMIGLSTNSPVGIHALTLQSKLSKFTAVLPVGIFLSCAGLLSYLTSQLVFKKQMKYGRGFGTLSFFFFLLSIVLMFQNYPRHGVISINTISIDINQYILRTLSIACGIAYLRNYRKYPLYLS